MPTRNESFDLVRILAFTAIVFLHMGATVSVQETPLAATINAVARFAVPSVFAITGFFLVRADVRKLVKGFRKELVFTLCAVILYFALAFLGVWDWSGGFLFLRFSRGSGSVPSFFGMIFRLLTIFGSCLRRCLRM